MATPGSVLGMSWLPEGFVHPEYVELPNGHHVRPIRESDVDIDYPAVMGSRETLWARFGGMWGWPSENMTYEADRQDLARHEAEISAHVTFNYAVLNHDETELLGCVYIDPPGERTPDGADAWCRIPAGPLSLSGITVVQSRARAELGMTDQPKLSGEDRCVPPFRTTEGSRRRSREARRALRVGAPHGWRSKNDAGDHACWGQQHRRRGRAPRLCLSRSSGPSPRPRPSRDGLASSPAPRGSCRLRSGCPGRRRRRGSRGTAAPPRP